MGFSLDQVVPWGRSGAEYRAMFMLTPRDLSARILGCGDGPASFNAELSADGGRVVSVDPIYALDAERIRARIGATYDTVMAQLRANRADYLWDHIRSVEELGRIRLRAMDVFLADLALGKAQGRYVTGELPVLPFAPGSFDLALTSHLLFLYSDHLSAGFHLQAIDEMLRVAREVRIFPLLTLDGRPSPHLPDVIGHFADAGVAVERRRVPYEFQRGANEMLVLHTPRASDAPG